MSASGIANTSFNFSLFDLVSQSSQSSLTAANQAANSDTGSFSSTLALSMANFQSQTLGVLLGSGFGTDKGANEPTGLNALLASLNKPAANEAKDSLGTGLTATGRNAALFNPESAYNMMTVINNKDVTYKAQFSELSQMQSYVTEMQQEGQSLAGIKTSTSNDSIQSQLEKFAGHYNDWVQRFDADMQKGGLLSDTQAAQVSRYELEQSVENIFNGASDGLHGLSDLGFSIDPNTKLATFDHTKLNAVLASNKQGAVDTLQEFSANFAKSAELLNSAGNFIPNRLANLDRVIDYITDNKTALQAEFGLGNVAKPTGRVAEALAAYNKTYAV